MFVSMQYGLVPYSTVIKSLRKKVDHTCVLFSTRSSLQHADFYLNTHKFQMLFWVICVRDASGCNNNSWDLGDLNQISED